MLNSVGWQCGYMVQLAVVMTCVDCFGAVQPGEMGVAVQGMWITNVQGSAVVAENLEYQRPGCLDC